MMARRIVQLIDPQTRKRMGKAAFATYSNHPSWAESMRKATKIIYIPHN